MQRSTRLKIFDALFGLIGFTLSCFMALSYATGGDAYRACVRDEDCQLIELECNALYNARCGQINANLMATNKQNAEN